tara:strand:- start:202 stop:465 length:264 start_codon:yes stop_codon:yes gene_type:complete
MHVNHVVDWSTVTFESFEVIQRLRFSFKNLLHGPQALDCYSPIDFFNIPYSHHIPNTPCPSNSEVSVRELHHCVHLLVMVEPKTFRT